MNEFWQDGLLWFCVLVGPVALVALLLIVQDSTVRSNKRFWGEED